MNIILELNIVIGGDGLLDDSTKSGFTGRTFSNLAANP